jgi:hypothetical protein
MSQYPLDEEGVTSILNQLIQHSNAQNHLIQKLGEVLREAQGEADSYDCSWYDEAETLLKQIHDRKTAFQNFRFDQKNGHKTGQISPFEAGLVPTPEITEGGDTLSEAELAAYFNEPTPKPKKVKKEKSLNKMTLEEIKDWEKAQDNATDIYKVSARVKNLARVNGSTLTPVGEALCNLYTHVLKALYDFSDTVTDKEIKIQLVEVIKKQEGMPGNFITSVNPQVTK